MRRFYVTIDNDGHHPAEEWTSLIAEFKALGEEAVAENQSQPGWFRIWPSQPDSSTESVMIRVQIRREQQPAMQEALRAMIDRFGLARIEWAEVDATEYLEPA